MTAKPDVLVGRWFILSPRGEGAVSPFRLDADSGAIRICVRFD